MGYNLRFYRRLNMFSPTFYVGFSDCFFLKIHAVSQMMAIVIAEPATPAKLVQPADTFVSSCAASADAGVLIE